MSSDLVWNSCQNANLPLSAVRVAIGCYAEYPDEVDRQIAVADSVQERARLALERTGNLLDADATASGRDAHSGRR